MDMEPRANTSRLHARVVGRVQGVGYRWFVLRRAEGLALGGWVRNCADGDVEVMAEGPREHLERLLEALRKGPGASRVLRVDETWSNPGPEGEPGRFEVRY